MRDLPEWGIIGWSVRLCCFFRLLSFSGCSTWFDRGVQRVGSASVGAGGVQSGPSR